MKADQTRDGIVRVVRGCEFCGCTDTTRDVDGNVCCDLCGMTALDQGEGGRRPGGPRAV